MRMKSFSQYPRSSQAGFIVGIAFVIFGLFRLATMGHGPEWWVTFVAFVSRAMDFLWPIALMVVGGVILWAGLTGRLEGALAGKFNGPLQRSTVDRRLLGVCGGLAHFLGVNSVIVRVVAVLFLFVSPWFCLVVYLAMGLLMARA